MISVRLPNGEGSIVKLSGNRRKKYAARVTTGWKDGKQVRKYIGYYKTVSEAMLALAEYNNKGVNFDLTKLTLDELYERWVTRIEPNVSKNVLATHKMTHKRFGSLGNIQVVKIKADHLQDWMDNISDVSPGSKRQMKSTMIQIWKYAMKNDIVTNNYAEHIEIHEKSEKTGEIFSQEEITALWNNVDDHTAKWILVLMYTGMRIGELLEITRDDINFEENYMIGGSKTEAGRDRVIPMHSAIVPLVKDLLGDANDLIRGKRKNKLNYSNALKKFKAYMEDNNMDHLPHDTRKTAVSLMHKYGIPMETIRVIVGHSAKGVTEQVYLYHEPEELVKAINKIEI